MCCPGRRLITFTRGTLAEERPDLVKEWVHEANEDATPDSVGAGSRYRATWQCGCSCKHCSAPHATWQIPVQARTGTARRNCTNCPYCSGNKVCACQSIAALYPDLVKELDAGSPPELKSLGPGSTKPATWVCAMHGSWVARIHDRVRGNRCPRCAHSAKSGVSRPKRGLVKDEHPEIFAQVHPTLNGDLEALDDITCGSAAKLWWLCKEDKNRPQGCQHEHAWQTGVGHRCRKEYPTGCPFCAGQQVCECNSISKLKPELLQFWDYSRNSIITPSDLGPGTRNKVWWRHECCAANEEHVWQTSPSGFLRRYQGPSRPPCPICYSKSCKVDTTIYMGRTTKIKM